MCILAPPLPQEEAAPCSCASSIWLNRPCIASGIPVPPLLRLRRFCALAAVISGVFVPPLLRFKRYCALTAVLCQRLSRSFSH
eukprot:scaffold73643_cov20-Tisochrysis_lutea.AAC.2